MDFGERLAALRKEKGPTQQALAELINLHVIQVRRYESGASQPTLDVIRRLAVALQVSADVLIFGADERGPDGDLQRQFEAIFKFAPEEKKVIKALLEGMILKHEARRWSSAVSSGSLVSFKISRDAVYPFILTQRQNPLGLLSVLLLCFTFVMLFILFLYDLSSVPCVYSRQTQIVRPETNLCNRIIMLLVKGLYCG